MAYRSDVKMTLQEEILEDLTLELSSDDDFDANALQIKVKNAYKEVKARRNYKASSMNEEEIEADMQNYYSNILNIARYDYNQIGAEGQKAHTESSIVRSWVDRNELFVGVYAFVEII